MDLHELRVAARLIDGLAKRALFAEKQMVALEGQCAEWKRIADDLKAERNAEREAHAAIKQALGIQSAKDAGKVLGMVDGEGLRGAAERVVKERDALRAECDDLRRVFALVHGSLGIQQGEHIGNAIEALKKERDVFWQREGIEQKRRIDAEAQLSDTLADLGALLGVDGGMRSITAITTAIEKLKERNVELSAERERMKAELAVVRDERDTLRKERDALRADVSDLRTLCDEWKQRETKLLAEIERLKKPARQHPVAVGEWVERTESPYTNTPIGHKAQVVEVRHSTYRLSCGRVWEFRFCTPCDPPEASHDTPEGKQAAESAVKREPKPGDTVRLVRIPTSWDEQWGRVGDIAIIDSTGNEEVLLNSGWVWPISCIEILEDAK